jgi:hypothetical protein
MMKKNSSARGQTLVEFALMLPLLILIVLFLFDMGRAVYYYSVIHNAAREGARYGIILPDDDAGINAAAREKAIGLDSASLSIVASRQVGGTIQVQTIYVFKPVTPLILNFLRLVLNDPGLEGIVLKSQSTMVIEE